jgi:hypothetical protein
MQIDQGQLVRIVGQHNKDLERLKALGTPSSSKVNHTLCAFDPAVAVHAFGRVRCLPGTGLRYRVVSWAIMSDVNGEAVVDILKGSGYPPATTMCGGNRPRLLGGKIATGGVTGWGSTTINHGDYLILNIFSFKTIAQLGFSVELAPEPQ